MNVNLWFAKDVDNNEIISVVNSDNKKVYMCPICNSIVIPKAIESKKITPHFAHVDKSKCSSESMIHFWFKNLFIEQGESFIIDADKKIEYVCKNFKTEVRYELENGLYIPDIVVETECGNEIVFEMANTNKKQVKDYIDKWIELDKIVVEVDIKSLVNDSKEFKALYYKGKCFNFNKRDGGYYNTIGKLKENLKTDGRYDEDYIKKLDWFWDEVTRFNNKEVGIGYMSIIINQIKNHESHNYQILEEILRKSKCTNLHAEYKKYLELDNSIIFNSRSVYEELERMISDLNESLNKIDANLNVDIQYHRRPIYKSYFHGSRKHMYKSKEVDCKYEADVRLKVKNKSRLKIPITNRFMSFTQKEKYVLDKILESITDKRKCVSCEKRFILTKDELKFYLGKEFALPKRCKACRHKKDNTGVIK